MTFIHYVAAEQFTWAGDFDGWIVIRDEYPSEADVQFGHPDTATIVGYYGEAGALAADEAVHLNKSWRLPLVETDPVQFFFEHAGFSYDPKIETPEVGRLRCARLLAAAEADAHQEGYTFGGRADPNPMWDDDVKREHTDYDQWLVTLFDEHAEAVACLGSIDLGPDADPETDPYIRVIKAELACAHLGY